MSDEETKSEGLGAKLQALIVCDEIIRDADSGKISLINCFTSITSKAFPCVHDTMNVHILLTGGHGNVKCLVRLIKADVTTVEDYKFEMAGPVNFPTPLTVAALNFRLRKLPFPEPGEYVWEVYVDEKLAGSRRLALLLGGD